MPNSYHLSNTRENNIFKSDAVDFSKGEYGEVDDDREENGEKNKLRSEGDNVDDDGGIFREKKKYVQKLSSAFCEGDGVDDDGDIFREKKRK